MLFEFEKYQGAGNDFILIDNRSGDYNHINIDQITWLCNRHYGVGSDGLILLNLSTFSDFEMDFYNPDGSKSFCGNGARCAVAFAHALGIESSTQTFHAIDGVHQYTFNESTVAIQMRDVDKIELLETDSALIHTGSPHYIMLSEDLSTENTLLKGRAIRYSEPFKKEGVNVNLIRKKSKSEIDISTYERGVEHETLACGTGATACALYYAYKNDIKHGEININAKGGKLVVRFVRNNSGFENIWLIGPAEKVFSGNIFIS